MTSTTPTHGVEARLLALDERMARIESLLGRLDAAEGAARSLVAMGTDAVDRAAVKDPEELEARLRALIGVLDRLSRPETIARLDAALDAAEKLPTGLAIATDTIDRFALLLGDRGVDLSERLVTLFRLLERLTSPEILAVLEQGLQHHEAASRILRSGAFDPAALDIIGKLAGALSVAAEHPPRIGVWGAMRAAGTAPVQHALGFAVALASRFGQAIADSHERRALTRGEE